MKRLIVVGDDHGRTGPVARALGRARYDVSVATEMTDIGPSDYLIGIGADLAPTLRRAGNTPFVILQPGLTPTERLSLLRGGAHEVLSLDGPEELLTARLRGLLRDADARQEYQRRRATAAKLGFEESTDGFAHQRTIAYVGDGMRAEKLRGKISHQVVHMTAAEALDASLQSDPPDVYAIDCTEAQRHTLVPELRDRGTSPGSPILVRYNALQPDAAVQALDLGAADIVASDALLGEVVLRLTAMLSRRAASEALRQADEKTYEMASVDQLTGLYNRRYADAYLNDVMTRAANGIGSVAVMMVDIDHFKSINDTFGHPAGDSVLAEVAHRMRANMRAVDLVARFGGEEFLIVMPDTTELDAVTTAERLRRAVADTPFALPNGQKTNVTVSIGVSIGAGADTLSIADAALYRAKVAGRNRIDVSRDEAA